jgi:hypothetical protein
MEGAALSDFSPYDPDPPAIDWRDAPARCHCGGELVSQWRRGWVVLVCGECGYIHDEADPTHPMDEQMVRY